MSKYAIYPATSEDISTLATVSRAAFRDNPDTISYWIFPKDNEKAIYEWRLGGITNTFHNIPECSYTKCVEVSTNKIVAFALWEGPQPRKGESEEPEGDERKSDRVNGIPKDSKLPEGTNVELMNVINKCTGKMRDKYVDSEKDYSKYSSFLSPRRCRTECGLTAICQVLRALATLPEHQGKGCGTLLLKSGLEKVDAEGRKVWLEATPQGRHLYVKLGWKDVAEEATDLGEYGSAGGVQVTLGMMREASV